MFSVAGLVLLTSSVAAAAAATCYECCKNSFTLPASGVGSVVRLLGSAAATNNAGPSATMTDS